MDQPSPPPSGAPHVLELELDLPTPRPIPASVLSGPYVRRERTIGGLLVVSGALLAALPFSPGAPIGDYILPLAYGLWIGLPLVALGGWRLIRLDFGRGDLCYVIHGIPSPARVLHLRTRAKGAGSHVTYELVVEYETAAGVKRAAVSPRQRWRSADWSSARLRAGDPVTAIRLPGASAPETIYPLLELTEASSAMPPGTWRPVRTAIVGGAALIAVFSAIYAIHFCEPLDMPASMMIPSLGVGVGAAAWAAMVTRRVRLTFLSLLLGVFAGMCFLSIANAALDRSPPAYTIVEVRQFTQTTHHFVIRDYSIDYFDPMRNQSGKVATSLAQIRRFPASVGALETRAGHFGWRWARQIHPVVSLSGVTRGDATAAVELEDGSVIEVEQHPPR